MINNAKQRGMGGKGAAVPTLSAVTSKHTNKQAENRGQRARQSVRARFVGQLRDAGDNQGFLHVTPKALNQDLGRPACGRRCLTGVRPQIATSSTRDVRRDAMHATIQQTGPDTSANRNL